MVDKKLMERIKLQVDVEEFLKKGGIIKEYRIGETAYGNVSLTYRQKTKTMNTNKLKEE